MMEQETFSEEKQQYGSLGDIQGEVGFHETRTSEQFEDDETLFKSTIHGQKKQGTLGGFVGVFVPCVLSIFGVIIFERLGWVIGQVSLMNSQFFSFFIISNY